MRDNIISKGLKLIQRDPLLNIGMGVLTIVIILLWHTFRWDGLVTSGIYLSLYWALFFWLQITMHKKVKREASMSIRSKLLEQNKESLIRLVMSNRVRIHLLDVLFALYSLGVAGLLCTKFGVDVNWIIMLSIGISWVYLVYSATRSVAYIREIYKFNKELLNVDNYIEVKEEMDLKRMESIRQAIELEDKGIQKEEIETFCNLAKVKRELDVRVEKRVEGNTRTERVRF